MRFVFMYFLDSWNSNGLKWEYFPDLFWQSLLQQKRNFDSL